MHTLSAYNSEHTFIIHKLWTKHSEVIVQSYQWNFFLKHQDDWPNSDLFGGKPHHLVSFSTTYAVLYHKNERKYNNTSSKWLNLQTCNALTVAATGLLFLTVFWPFCCNSLNKLKSEYFPIYFPALFPSYYIWTVQDEWLWQEKVKRISRAPWTLPNVLLQFKINWHRLDPLPP